MRPFRIALFFHKPGGTDFQQVIYIKRSNKELFKNNTNSDAARVCVFKGYSWRIFFPKESEAMKGRSRVARFSLAVLKNSLKDKQKLSVNPKAYACLSDS